MQSYKNIIKTEEQFRDIMGHPNERVSSKVLNHLDQNCQTFIQKTPFIILSTANKQGQQDTSPKGDPAGFIKIINPNTIAIPERLGNRKADSFTNIIENPNVGLLFMIPGKKETLRASGTAIIVRDQNIREDLAFNNKLPDFAFIITIKEAYFHCAKCMTRSKLWQAEHWPNQDGLPTLGKTMVDAGKLELSAEEMDALIEKDYKNRLY